MARRPGRVTLLSLAVGIAVVGVGAAALVLARSPRADRDWTVDQAVAARITLGPDSVRIAALRNFRHRPGGESVPAYEDVAYALDDVRGVWFALAPFARRWRGLAHSFVSFELSGGRFVSVSVEARREVDESYSLLGGLLRAFEVAYVVGTEEDVVGLRAVRGDTLFLYPSRATPEQARALFVDMLGRAEALRSRPEFYHTLTNNCATNLRDHVNRVAPEPLPYGWAVVFPGYSDRLALEHGLLDTELPLEEARTRFRVDERARAALAEGGDFSTRIRQGNLPASSDPRPPSPDAP